MGAVDEAKELAKKIASGIVKQLKGLRKYTKISIEVLPQIPGDVNFTIDIPPDMEKIKAVIVLTISVAGVKVLKIAIK